MTSPPPLAAARPVEKREILAWCLYDWANSAYSTLQITIVVVYLPKVVLPGDAGNIAYSWTIGLTTLCAAILSPLLGAIADARATKWMWLAIATLPAAAASAGMGLVPPTYPWVVLAFYIIANLGYELSQGFYNAFLPELADDESMNRISAWGFALGYIGGAMALVLALLVLLFGAYLGLPPDAPETADDATKLAVMAPRLRVGLLIMGCWWGLFSLPAIFTLRDRCVPRSGHLPFLATARGAFSEVGRTLANVRTYRTLFLFLVAFLIYNDGVQTIITQSSIFAQEVLKVGAMELVLLVLMIQFVSMPGAMFMGWLADRWGQKKSVLLCIGVYMLWLLFAFFIEARWQFWLMGVVLAFIMGGIQAVSRAIMGLLTPPARSGEFFGFFNLSGKATSFAGPMLFSSILVGTKSPQLAILSLLIFFIVGGALVTRVDVARGQREAQAG